jgi:hypothetical protein
VASRTLPPPCLPKPLYTLAANPHYDRSKNAKRQEYGCPPPNSLTSTSCSIRIANPCSNIDSNETPWETRASLLLDQSPLTYLRGSGKANRVADTNTNHLYSCQYSYSFTSLQHCINVSFQSLPVPADHCLTAEMVLKRVRTMPRCFDLFHNSTPVQSLSRRRNRPSSRRCPIFLHASHLKRHHRGTGIWATQYGIGNVILYNVVPSLKTILPTIEPCIRSRSTNAKNSQCNGRSHDRCRSLLLPLQPISPLQHRIAVVRHPRPRKSSTVNDNLLRGLSSFWSEISQKYGPPCLRLHQFSLGSEWHISVQTQVA